MKKGFSVVLILCQALLLTACLLPEKFEVSFTFKPDGRYAYRYDGTVVGIPAVMEIHEEGSLSSKLEEELKEWVAENYTELEKMEYLGSGRYEASVSRELEPELEPSTPRDKFFDFIKVTKDEDGVITLSGSGASKDEADYMKGIGVSTDGDLRVYLPENATVVYHNAKRSPGGLNQAYEWDLTSWDQEPLLLGFKLE